MLIDISSLTNFSSLDITGSATLDGTVPFDVLNGYVPQSDDSFAFLDAAGVTGNFSNFDFVEINCTSCSAGFNGSNFTFSLDTGSMLSPPTPPRSPPRSPCPQRACSPWAAPAGASAGQVRQAGFSAQA